MNKGLLIGLSMLMYAAFLQAQNPSGDLRIEMFDYFNLVVDHNVQTPAGASPKSVYIGVKICNDGSNDMSDVFAFIGDYNNSTPGIYPEVTHSSGPFTGTFSFTHEGGTDDATRYLGDLGAGECITQYWLLSYPLVDASNNNVTGANSNQNDDLHLTYDVWSTAIDNGNPREAEDSKTVHLRAMLSASANKIWPNTTSKVPNSFLNSFPDEELGWRMTTDVTHPGASVVLEGIWFDCGNVNKGFDNDGDYQYDYNFMLQPVGNPAVFDPNCFRLVKVSGLIVVKPKNSSNYSFEFEDQLHFEDLPKNTGAVGMVFYEFAIINGPCSADLTPYQAAASGKNREKFNSDFGLTGGTLGSLEPTVDVEVTAPASASPGDQIEVTLQADNTSSVPMGMPEYGAHLVIEAEIPSGISYTSGSAQSNNSLPVGMTADILYSTDNGTTWQTNEPFPSTSINLIQWWVSDPLQPTDNATVTFDVNISPTYSSSSIIFNGALSTGNRDPFATVLATVNLQGGNSISGIVFLDDGAEGGIIGNGIQDGSEVGIPSISVELYNDLNGNGTSDYSDVLVAQFSSLGTGAFLFSALSDGDYVVKVDETDGDLPVGTINTTPLEYAVNISGSDAQVDFGFAAILEVTNTLTSNPIVSESDFVNYQVQLQNLSYTTDTDNSSTVTAWASALDPATNFDNNPNNLLGAPDVGLAWPNNWSKTAKVKGFDFGVQPGTIEKVEIIISICLDYDIYNDYLTVSFEKESGGTAYVPDPALSKNSTPSLNDYVGPPNIGWLILDITDIQDWDWSVFDANWAITMDGIVVNSDDGSRQYTDAIGVRVTTTCCASEEGEPGNCQSTLTELPMEYEYDETKLEFVSSAPPADGVSNGVVTFNQLGPLYPNETKLVDLQFRALNPPVLDNNCTLPEPVSYCTPPTSGYHNDVTINGNVNWNSILSSVDPSNMYKKVRISGTGTVTVPSGDLNLSSSSSLLVLDGVELVVASGNLILENSACAIFTNAVLRTWGNIEQKGGSYFCIYSCEVECGDEESNGYFSGGSTSANFTNDGGTRHLENVCLNVTQNYTLLSTSGGNDVLINVCAEIGDQGANDAATGIIDGSDSGSFSTSKSIKIFNSRITVIENVTAQSGGSMDVCATNFRTLNGNFQSSGTLGGYDLAIWVDDSHTIDNNGGSWDAAIEARRGNTTGSISGLPANLSVVDITPHFENCACSGDITTGDPNSTTTLASVTDAKNCDGFGLPISDSDEADGVTLINLGSVTGYVFGDSDNDGWQGIYGYENGTDNFIPGVEVNLYGCFDDNGDLIYDNASVTKRCTHGWNDGHWELVESDTTDANGIYRMAGIDNGYYYLEIDETTLTNAADQTADPDVTNGLAGQWADKRWKDPNEDLRDMGIIGIGNDHTQINFGYYILTTIAGVVWNDINGDGVKDPSEPTIPNVPVEFNHSGCTTGSNCAVRYTNGQGEYELTTAVAGVNYNLSVDLNSVQGADTWIITFESDGTTDNSNAITVSQGQQVFNVDFGLQASGPLNMGGTVYFDWIGNAHQDAGDEGMPGVRVQLYKDNNQNGSVQPSDQLVQTIVTDINGAYLFANKPSDSYVITLDESSVPIFPKQTEDPDEYGPCTVCDAKTAVTTTSDNFIVSITDVWDYYNAFNSGCEICDEGYTSSSDPPYISNDLDLIDFQDPINDPGACVTELVVTFNIAASDIEKSYNTAYVDNVEYFYPIELNGVQIGTFNPTELPYWCGICESIEVVFPVDLNVIPYNFGGTNTLDINFRSYNLTLPSNQRQDMCVADIKMEFLATNCSTDYLTLDFGYEPTGGTGEIIGYVFLDDNANGVQNNGEERIGEVEVRLECDLNKDGVFNWVESTVTDNIGNLSFNELLDGDYKIVVNEVDSDLPIDYTGAPAQLTTLGNQSCEIDNFELVEVNGLPCSGPCDTEQPAFGFAMPGAATGYVFSDDNGNGTQDEKEQGLGNVDLYICNAVDGFCNATNALDTVSSANGAGIEPMGFYIFAGLPAGNYVIAVDQPSVPTGYELTADPSTDGIPCYSPLDVSDPNFAFLTAECDHETNGISISLGSQYTGANFGYKPPGVIGGLVWFDDNEDGVIDDDEDGLEEIKLELTNLTAVTIAWVLYNPGEYVAEKYSDIDGNYVFTNMPDGSYQIEVELPTDYFLTFDADGVLDNITQVVISGGDVTNTGNPWCANSDCSLEVDFGMSPNFINTLAGVVCLDGDEDGRCDTGGETFPEGTEVSIFDLSGISFGETTAAADGTFFFDNLPTADMVVSVSKTVAPLRLTSLTTSLGDTPAYDIIDSDNNAIQYVSVSGAITNMHNGFTFSDTFDLGDLPAPFLTRADGASPGPAHIIPAIPTLYLGAAIDAEVTPTISVDADGDDNSGLDDEDGVTFTNAGTWVTGAGGGGLSVVVNGNGYLVGFADFNVDGDFDDGGEMILNETVAPGTYNYNFDIPIGTDLSGGQDFYLRFRLFENAPFSASTSYNGITDNGEVEDYMVSVCKNLADAGTVSGAETGCNGYDPSNISETLAVSGGGGNIEYLWEESTDGGLTWSVIVGATSASFDPGAIILTTRYRRGARRFRCAAYIYSNAVIKTVVTNYTNAGLIVGDEDNCGIFDPDLILNVIAPSGGTGTTSPFYQWEQSIDNGNTWGTILNANEEFYNPGVISQTTLYRRGAQKTPCAVFLYSNVVTKMVSVNYIDAGSIDGDESVCGTFDPTLITSLSLASGGVDGFEMMLWQESTNNGASWSDIPGATNATYNPGLISQTTWYRRKSRRVPCVVWVNSNVVTKTVRPFPTANILTYPISASGYLCELTGYDFEAEDAGANVAYSWDFGAYSTPSAALGQGAHQVEFDVPDNIALTSTIVTLTTSMDGCVSNDNRVLTFRPEIIIDSISTQNPTMCLTNDGIIWVHATYPTGTTIEYSVNGGITWNISYETNSLAAGVYDVRVRYQGGDCVESYGIVALSDPPPQADLLVSSSEECTGQTVTIEAVPTNGSPVFTWAFGNGAIPNTASGAGPHSVYFTNGGYASIAVTMIENNCVGVRDTSISIVENYSDGGTVLGGETLCSTFDPANIVAGANPSGGTGGTLVYQWENREDDGAGGFTAWGDVVGANSASYDPSIIGATTEFRRKSRRAPCANWVASNTVLALLVQKPNLIDDNYATVCPGFAYADNVSDNDLDLVNPTYSLLVFPTNGTLDFEVDGEFIYDPNSTYCGTDEFQYLVCNDGTGCCDTAQVIIDLTDNNPPTILNVPSNLTISCDDQIPVADAVDVVEDCQTVSIGTDQISTQGVDSCALNNYQITRIWKGVDYCSNTATSQQVIVIEDKTSPDIYRIYTLPNGQRMVAGVMENVSNHWKTISLPIQFSQQPVIFTQLTTRNDATPAVARLRNVSTTQFQLKLQEEEGNDGVHAKESVAWVAFEKGIYNGTNPFEVNTWLLTSSPTNNPFNNSYASTPDFFLNIQSNNEIDPANPRVQNLSNIGVDAWISEETSSDGEITHNIETVGYLAMLGTGNITNNAGEVIGELGRVDLTNVSLHIDFLNEYHNPVVVIGAIGLNENDPVTTRVTTVTNTGFDVYLDEWDYLDGVHGIENLSYLVVEGSLPLNQTVNCDGVPEPLHIGTQIIAVDNCDATIQLLMTENDLDFNCQSDTTFSRTWTTVDDCGNITTLIETYILLDTVPPTFTVPASLTIVCNDDKDDLALTGDVPDELDNCSEVVTVVYSDNLDNLISCNGYIERTWTATDNCGNQTIKTQLIYVSPEEDTDRDGTVDYFDLDDDNDGIPDLIETNADADGDGIPNDKDLDSDNDGIPDIIEIGGTDINGDGVVDNVGEDNWDNDNDGFAFGFDGNDIDPSVVASVVLNPLSLENDRDGDGVSNFIDRDSDNDGIPDLVEIGGVDTDGDGVIDFPVLTDPLTMQDNDNDGFADIYDPDIDNLPGIESPDKPLVIYDGSNYSGGLSSDQPDNDGDMVPDFFDSDSDNDGTGDLIEAGGIDVNGDGRLELTASFIDLNNDGFSDIYVSFPLVFTDGDGIVVDGRPEDMDGNGTVYESGDIDQDGSPNHHDLDSDGDNIIDILETGLAVHDGDGDGIWDNWTDTNLNGYDDEAEALGNIMTEGDGANLDGRAEDSGDADETAYLGAQPDGTFAEANGNPDIDDDADGLLNFLDTDSDNDFLPDGVEDQNHNNIQDEGETGIYNPDSDFDNILDGIEDHNQDGVYSRGETNPLNPNTDGDGLQDGEEDLNGNGIIDPIESDPTNACDPVLNEACRGIVLDIKVKLLGALVDQDSIGLMRDDLRFKKKIPYEEPYTGIVHLAHFGEDNIPEYNDPNGGGGNNEPPNSGGGLFRESFDLGMMYVTGTDAPVDWILVELRAASNPDSIVATKAGLLQRDGDIRDVDGLAYVTFDNVSSGNYYVAVRHRNHLGIMSASPYLLSPDVAEIDFTKVETEVYGENSRSSLGGIMSLWAGDLNGDGNIIYQGQLNDVLPLFINIVLDGTNADLLANFIVSGYNVADFNLDGDVIFQGPNNDKAKLLIYSVLGSPENSLQLANFVLMDKLP